MTVEELIEELQNHDPKLEVYIWTDHGQMCICAESLQVSPVDEDGEMCESEEDNLDRLIIS